MATPRLANLRLPGSDGGPLYVDVRTGARPGEGRPTVVICHGFKGFKDWGFFPRLAERLALAGCTAVTFNFSGSGVGPASDIVDEPDRWFRQTLGNDLADLETVITHVASAAPPWIGLVGHSRGGGTAIIQAARDPRVRALVTWAAVAGFVRYTPAELERWRHDGRMEVVNSRTGQVLPIGTALLDDLDACGSGSLDVLAAAARVRVPWLLIHGTADETVAYAESEALAGASRSVRTNLLMVEGAGHTFGARHPWAGSTSELNQVIKATAKFLSGTLG
ncbi:MAG: alpha/beta fold hydrolase [Gemmatimonadota bacterium]